MRPTFGVRQHVLVHAPSGLATAHADKVTETLDLLCAEGASADEFTKAAAHRTLRRSLLLFGIDVVLSR